MWDQLCLATENGVFRAEKQTEAEQSASVVQTIRNKILWYQEQVERKKRGENVSVAKILEDRLRKRARLKQLCLHMLMFEQNLETGSRLFIFIYFTNSSSRIRFHYIRQCDQYRPSVWNSVFLEWGEASPRPPIINATWMWEGYQLISDYRVWTTNNSPFLLSKCRSSGP